MAIAKNPKRNLTTLTQKSAADREAEAFISGARQHPGNENDPNKKQITVRFDPDILERVDRAAKRLGISRAAFIVSSAAERLERME